MRKLIWIVVPLIAVLYTGWVMLAALGMVRTYLLTLDQYLYIGSALFILLIALMLWQTPKRAERGVAVEEVPKPPEKEKRVKAETPPTKGERIITYPEELSGGIYTDTHIPLTENLTLNLRSVIGRACLLCEERERCWERLKGDISINEFLASIKCWRKKYGENA